MNLAEENRAVLMLVQALRGVISANMRRISICHDGKQWRFRFVLEREDRRDRDEIGDVPAEFEALYPGPMPCIAEVEISSGSLRDLEPMERVVFWRRED